MMAFDDRSLDDYVDVPQRLADFRQRHPEGGLQPADPATPYHIVRVPNHWCRQCIGRRTVKDGRNWKKCPRCDGSGIRLDGEPREDVFVVYAAAARRSADDPHPGVGMAWEPYPGQTPYTSGSELQNAETSAWGRAIVAALASDSKRGIASREEVRNRAADEWETAKPASRNGQQQPPPDGGEWETEAPADDRTEAAQAIADEACQARAVGEISRLHAKAADGDLLVHTVRNPATGGEGLLKAYLAWRRNQLSAEARVLAELRKAGQAAGLEGEALDARVQELVGAGIEAATVTQMKEAAAKLATAGAAS